METIREVNLLKTEAARMEDNIAQLDALNVTCARLLQRSCRSEWARALIEVRRARDVRALAESKTAMRNSHAADSPKTEQKIADQKTDVEKLESKHDDVQARIAKDNVYATKTKLEALIADQEREMTAVLGRIASGRGPRSIVPDVMWAIWKASSRPSLIWPSAGPSLKNCVLRFQPCPFLR